MFAKAAAFVIMCAPSFVSARGGELELQIKTTFTDGSQSRSMSCKTYASRAGVRSECESGGSLKRAILLLHERPDTIYVLDPTRKTYWHLRAPERQDKPEPSHLSVEVVGRQRIAGYECAHSLVKDDAGGGFEAWTTSAIVVPEYMAIQNSAAGIWRGMHEALGKARVNGFPMKVVNATVRPGLTVSWEVIRVRKLKPRSSLFSLNGFTPERRTGSEGD